MRILLLLVVLVASTSACKNKIPNGILPKDQMQSVLWDVMQAEAYTDLRTNIKSDTLINSVLEDAKLQEQVFNIHHISRQDFYKSYDYYKEHTDLLMAVLDSITAQGNRNENTRLTIKAKMQAAMNNAKAKARMDSIKASGLKNNNLSLNQKLIPPIDSNNVLKNKQRALLKSKPKKHLPKKHKIIPAPQSN